MATPADKYRINALAKDLGVKTKEITDLLSAAGKGQKSPMTALEPDELSLVFEHITQQHQVDIEAFFRQYEEKKKALAHRGARGRHTRYEQCQPRQI